MLLIRSSFKKFPGFSAIWFARIATVNKVTYIDILCRLNNAIRRKRLQKWKTNRWFLPHDNAPAHRSDLVRDFLAENNVTRLENRLNLLTRLQLIFTCSRWKGGAFCDATYIFKNATKELKRISWYGFQECFQHLYSSWQMCIVAQRDQMEGNVA